MQFNDTLIYLVIFVTIYNLLALFEFRLRSEDKERLSKSTIWKPGPNWDFARPNPRKTGRVRWICPTKTTGWTWTSLLGTVATTRWTISISELTAAIWLNHVGRSSRGQRGKIQADYP